jgi:hypothetical protein
VKLNIKDLFACFGAAALGGFAAVVLMGAAQERSTRAGRFKIVEAESFVLRDRHGVARGRFEWRTENDDVFLSLTDGKGIKHFASTLKPNGGVTFTLGADDEPGQITLVRDADTEAGITISRKESEIGIRSHKSGDSEFALYDQLRTRRASLTVKDDGTPSLLVMDAEGKAIYKAPPPEE